MTRRELEKKILKLKTDLNEKLRIRKERLQRLKKEISLLEKQIKFFEPHPKSTPKNDILTRRAVSWRKCMGIEPTNRLRQTVHRI